MSSGFTLVEMVVVLAIITVISGVVLSSQTSFNKTLVLANTAYDIALTVRSVETFGVSSSGLSVNGVGYGLHFDTASPTSFTLFKDIDPAPSNSFCHSPLPLSDPNGPDAKRGDCVYNPDPTKGEWVKDYKVENGIYISRFCTAKASGDWKCKEVGVTGTDEEGEGDAKLSFVDIVFTRPNPSPFIAVNRKKNKIQLRSKACLEISAPGSSITRSIFILPSGAITVSATRCQAG